ncbi:MAG TPA: helix-turn-helix transcriptional regulator [Pseudonocardiaceae bacterium]|jgi:transcriptional regulator with XRE-family HTH domain|nr:helix-turn-helix transcriptional regulator [Pseudonocardiaceae bacterium]
MSAIQSFPGSAIGTVRTEPIGQLVRRARHARGMSQYALAAALATMSGNDGVNREAVARWERGRRVPGPYWRHWLAVALNLPGTLLGAAARCSRPGRPVRSGAGESR